MQAVQAPTDEGAHAPQDVQPRQKPASLASIAISSFAAFRSQSFESVPVAVQSPVRRKPLPANSPVVGRFTADQSNSLPPPVPAKDYPVSSQRLNLPVNILSPPWSDEDSFLPRNLDE
jgi:hypothetical protein